MYNTRVTLSRDALTEEQVWALQDALIGREIPGVLMDSTVAADLRAGSVEVEHYVLASDGPAALGAALMALHDVAGDGQWKLTEALFTSDVPVAA